MAQYLTARWDYIAEGDFELSFKEGDLIKLLEKHNDDWWEGELNDEIGFFPANRTTASIVKQVDTLETEQITTDLVKKASISSKSLHGSKTYNSNPYLNNEKQEPVATSLEEQNLPEGWSQSHDDSLDQTMEKPQWTEEQKRNALPKSTLSRWFSRSGKNSSRPSCQDLIFGGHLKLEDNGDIPLVVKLCIDQVDKRGLDVVGIYRLSGQSTSIQKYKALFNSNQCPVLDNEPDINVITGLLKLYFRELKNPLLTFEYYDRFIEAARLEEYDERMFRLKAMIQVLPVAHYKVFQYLVKHLGRVQQQSKINKMEASNLALIFAIGLLRPRNEDISASILHTDLVSKVVETVILHANWFFDTDISTDDETSSNNTLYL